MDRRRSAFHSPFFHPQFVSAVGEINDRVHVAVAYRDCKPIGLLPFEQSSKRLALPVGGFLSNRQGWIASPNERIDFGSLLEQTGLHSYRYHLLQTESAAHRSLGLERRVAHADMSQGFAGYAEHKKRDGSTVLGRLAQKERKLARELGPLRVVDDYSDEVFDRMIQWKRIACQKRGVRNILDSTEALHIVRSLANVSSDHFVSRLTQLWQESDWWRSISDWGRINISQPGFWPSIQTTRSIRLDS